MGWFENQIEERRKADRQLLEDSFVRAAGVVMGGRQAERFSDERIITKSAIDEIIKYYHFRPADLPDKITDREEQLDYCLRPHGIMRRDIILTDGWHRDAYGPMLAFTKEEGTPVALLPSDMGGYVFNDPSTGSSSRVNAETAAMFDRDAVCFYRPLPLRSLGIPDLLLYMKRAVTTADITLAVAAAVAVTLIGMFLPRITKVLTGPVLSSGRTDALAGIGIFVLCVAASQQLIRSASNLIMKRIELKTSLSVESAMMMRLLSLPANFFREYSPGELKSRATAVSQLCSLLQGMVMTAGLSSVTSLLYVKEIFDYAPPLVIPSLIIIILTVAVSTATARMQTAVTREAMNIDAKESGMSYALLTGIQKIKLAGAEKRLFARWLNLYSEGAALAYDPPMILKISDVLTLAISLISNIVLYYLAVRAGIDPSSYFAFTAAYGSVMGAFTLLAGTAISAAQIRPILEMSEPILKAVPENADGKETVTSLSGNIQLDHVYFRYSDDTPYIIRNLSLKIKAGEYVALVGKTGCGKSTLMRLLLGFEKPERGAIYYDNKEIGTLDPQSLRRKIGTVMQDAGLFQGDIFSNISIAAPGLTMEQAWEAAEKAGIADDIREMPMGMRTVIAEGQGGISGGQRQRIMIARAIAPKPQILFFDEATSALDNKTQKKVSEALDSMGCTRIVIAHRLSTIKHCGRILVLDEGRIIEEGTYDELIEKGGFFADLVDRQRLDNQD